MGFIVGGRFNRINPEYTLRTALRTSFRELELIGEAA
jgi:hypothetical protein